MPACLWLRRYGWWAALRRTQQEAVRLREWVAARGLAGPSGPVVSWAPLPGTFAPLSGSGECVPEPCLDLFWMVQVKPNHTGYLVARRA